MLAPGAALVALAVCAGMAGGGCHHDLARARPGGPALSDGSIDARRSDSRADARPDGVDDAGRKEAELVCQPPALVGDPTGQRLDSPAISTDGLTLYAKDHDAGHFSTTRASAAGPFGAWTAQTTLPGETLDPTFFEHAGQPLVLAAEDRRTVQLCSLPLPGTCSTVSVLTAEGKSMSYNVDGPFVFGPAGQPMMAFNTATGFIIDAMWLAEPSDLTDLTKPWKARLIDELNTITIDRDDPTLSPDGTVIVFGRMPRSQYQEDLAVAYRIDDKSAFSADRLLEAVNTDDNEMTPELHALSGADFELYFTRHSKTDDSRRVLRSSCRLERPAALP